MSDRVDRILELLDNGTQSTDEPAYPTKRGARVDATCWRCGAPATTGLETCDACRSWMACETDVDPAAARVRPTMHGVDECPGALVDSWIRDHAQHVVRRERVASVTFEMDLIDEDTLRTVLGMPALLELPPSCDLLDVSVDLATPFGVERPGSTFTFAGRTPVIVDGCDHPVMVGHVIVRHDPALRYPEVRLVEAAYEEGDPDHEWRIPGARDVEVTADVDWMLNESELLAPRRVVGHYYRVHVHRGRRA